MKNQEFIERLEDEKIIAAIREAEAKTSGEIRVFISRKEVTNPVAAAQEEFTRMGMTKTDARNGVLIFVAPRSQNFAIIGDIGINQRCGEHFWQEVAGTMGTYFRQAEFTAGIVRVIHQVGALLAEHFPRRADDKNELSDAVERD